MRAAVVIVVMVLAGCENGAAHDVQYYIDHPVERTALREQCANDARRAVEANCMNADTAALRSMFSDRIGAGQ